MGAHLKILTKMNLTYIPIKTQHASLLIDKVTHTLISNMSILETIRNFSKQCKVVSKYELNYSLISQLIKCQRWLGKEEELEARKKNTREMARTDLRQIQVQSLQFSPLSLSSCLNIKNTIRQTPYCGLVTNTPPKITIASSDAGKPEQRTKDIFPNTCKDLVPI